MAKDFNNYRLAAHLVIDNIRSAYNVGSFFRTADAAGHTMLHICGISPCPPHPKLEKTALGAIESVPWAYYETVDAAIDELNESKIPVYAVEITDSSTDYRKIQYAHPSAFILGHEKRGVSQSAIDLSDHVVHIPMRGKKRSLNVATAAGIILYEALRSLP